MRKTLLLIPAALILGAAASNRSYRSLSEEPAPTRLPVPVAGVKVSQLRDSWGDPRSDGRSHEGIDIMAKRGTPVLSATHGIVSAVQERGNGGNTVSVHGPGGHSHYYAHLDSYGRFAEGDWVNVGDTLGYVGNTGNAQGGAPHLHYGIYTHDGAINPYPLLTGTKAAEAATPAKETSSGAASRRTSTETVSTTNSSGSVSKGTSSGTKTTVSRRKSTRVTGAESSGASRSTAKSTVPHDGGNRSHRRR